MTNALPGISANGALRAYQAVERGALPGDTAGQAADAGGGDGDFSALLGRALEGVVNTSQQAEGQAVAAISGHGDLTHVVTAVSRAQLALQTTVAVRDRVLQAYQDIIKMPI